MLRALGELHALGRAAPRLSNKDFVGALTGRGPRERLAGTLAAVAHGVDAGAAGPASAPRRAVTDFLRVQAALRGEVELAAGGGADAGSLPTEHHWQAVGQRFAAAAHNAPDANRPPHEEDADVHCS